MRASIPSGKRSRADIWSDEPSETARTVVEVEDDRFTGLYDETGRPIYRPKIPFGFVGKGKSK